jgi:hypothetical protein
LWTGESIPVAFPIAKRESFCGDRRLTVQINDSSESVTANIA